MPYKIVIAGTTTKTQACAETLHQDSRFIITGMITPGPKPVGRKKIISQNPLHLLAEKENIPVVLVENKITNELLTKITNSEYFEQPDYLLVVDFGYLVPKKLLEWPKIAPLNIHPSALPKWRGSSPGQFAILFGDQTSAVTLMVMDQGLDSGPVLAQHQFEIDHQWNHDDYYHFSFNLINKHLGDDIAKFAAGEIKPVAQQAETPTPLARRLSKKDSFVEWEIVRAATRGVSANTYHSALLQQASNFHDSTATLLSHAVRAFSPWPGLWTLVPTSKNQQRMKILRTAAVNGLLELEKVQLEGQIPATWNQIKNSIEE